MNLNHVTVPSIDLSRSLEFYELLGFHLIVDNSPNYVRFRCPNGESTFSIQRVDDLTPCTGIELFFETSDLVADVLRLVKLGVAFDQMPKMEKWLWQEARLTDPDGNIIVLFNPGENRINPPWKVG